MDSILAQQGVCTCVNGTCMENGNSCSTVAPAGPVGSAAYIAQQLALQNAAIVQQNAMTPFDFTTWVNANLGTIALAAGGLFLFAMAVKR